VCGLGIKERNFYEKNKRNDMVDKNKEAIRIEVDHTKVDDRGPLDLTRQVDETDKRIKELDNSLSIALEINDKFQRENKKLTDKVRKAEAMRRPLDTMDEIAYRELEKENKDLRTSIGHRIGRVEELNTSLAEALAIDEAHQKQMGKLQVRLTEVEEDNKKLAKQIENQSKYVQKLRDKGVI
jgi:chromosome segregation ATPase